MRTLSELYIRLCDMCESRGKHVVETASEKYNIAKFEIATIKERLPGYDNQPTQF